MAILHTNGRGCWSTEKRAVRITKITVEEEYDREVRVYFDKKTWSPEEHGLIYTDPLFLKELKLLLKRKGLGTRIDYTEQGMQGDNYVSLSYPLQRLKIKI